MANETIGDRLKARRLELGITQTELAKKVGLTQPAIAHLEKGIREKPRELLEIARALNLNPVYLSTGKGSKELTEEDKGACHRVKVTMTLMLLSDFASGAFVWDNAITPQPEINLFTPDPTMYAILVRGSAQSPRIKDHEFVAVSSMVPARPGDSVFVTFKDGRMTIQELVNTDNQLTTIRTITGLEQSYATEQIASIERIAMIVGRPEVT